MSYRCEGCGKTSRIAAHEPGCSVAAAWDAWNAGTTPDQVRAQTLKEVAAEFATLADVEMDGFPLFPDVESKTCVNFLAGWVESWANNPTAPPPWRSA